MNNRSGTASDPRKKSVGFEKYNRGKGESQKGSGKKTQKRGSPRKANAIDADVVESSNFDYIKAEQQAMEFMTDLSTCTDP
jgi:hypothetical protein